MSEKQAKALSRKEQGELTRQNLMDTGMRLFALNGYHGVSVRKLASEAGVNLAGVGYHFGGKSGLYEAILQYMIDTRHEIFPSVKDTERHFSEANGDRHAQARAVSWFMGKLAEGLLGRTEHIAPALIAKNELAQPSELFPKLLEEFFNPSFKALRTMVEHVLPDGTDKEEIIIAAHSIIGMVVIFLDGFHLVTARLEWENYEGHGAEKIAVVLGRRVRGFLGLPLE